MLRQKPTITEEERAQLKEDERKHRTKQTVTRAYLWDTVEGIFKAVGSRLNDLEDAVEKRLEMLEDAQLKYQGTFDKSQQYNPNDLCTHRGGLWICKAATRSAPGTSSDWQLTAKTPVARGGAK